MKTMFPKLITLGIVFLPLAAVAEAAFNPAVVSADAKWIVHIDVNNLRDSTLGKELTDFLVQLQPMMEQGGLHPDFKKILATASAITAYGSNFSQKPDELAGTLILQGTADLRKIAEAFVAQATITEPDAISEIKGLPFEAYSLSGGKATLAFPKEPVILFSKSQEQLKKAYEVFRGSAPSMAKSSSPLSGLLPKGGSYFLIAASIVPSVEGLPGHLQNGPQARILQMANSGSIAIGEEGAMTAARLQLVASSDDMADKLMRILQGVTAMLSLTETSDAQLTEFLKSVTVERKDARVSLGLAYPTERIMQMVHTIHDAEQGRNRPSQSNEDSAPAEPAPTKDIGQVVGEWWADKELGGASPAAENLTSRTFENVAIKTGATVTVSGRRGGGEHARIDYVELAPMAGPGAAVRYEAEFMRLNHYNIEKLQGASGGEIVRLADNSGTGTAGFRFQGADGSYRVKVGYVDESDGKSSFALGVQDSAAAVGPEAPASKN
jgi:hypothetical protein